VRKSKIKKGRARIGGKKNKLVKRKNGSLYVGKKQEKSLPPGTTGREKEPRRVEQTPGPEGAGGMGANGNG